MPYANAYPPTDAQRELLADLAAQKRVPTPQPKTKAEASEEIDALIALGSETTEIRIESIRAIRARCTEQGVDYEHMKAALGIDSLSASKGATEADANACRVYLDEQKYGKRRIPAPAPVAPPRAHIGLKKPTWIAPPETPVEEIAPVAASAPEEADPLPLALTEPYTPVVIQMHPNARLIVDLLPAREIERLTLGVTPATARAVLEALRARGCALPPADAGKGWPMGLTTAERNILGLQAPSIVFFGSVRDPRANSNWWSRNWLTEFAEFDVVEQEAA